MRETTQRSKTGGASAWLRHHLETFRFSLLKIAGSPISSLMTITVIGISIALPVTAYLLLVNAFQASAGWDASNRISLYLESDSPYRLEEVRQRLRDLPQVHSHEYRSPDDALEEFRELSGFGEALDALSENPLPPVLIVTPVADLAPPDLALLADELMRLPGVELAQLDVEWVQRLRAILLIVQRSVGILAILLGIAVLLVVGNTIRLDIFNRRAEIEVVKLIGATDGFIRRPFLYGGVWYGLLGGLLAIVLSQTALELLHQPVEDLAQLYGSGFRLEAVGWSRSLLIVGGAVLLGWAGSWLAVGRHLRQIQPK